MMKSNRCAHKAKTKKLGEGTMPDKGLLLVVSGPSGTGKGTVIGKVMARNRNMKYSVSATTRPMRPGDIEEVTYFFKTEPEFCKMIEQNELLEWDEYCSYKYGTPALTVKACIEKGYDVVLELTISGAMAVKKAFPECVTIFIMPPSFEELEYRIRNRKTESEKAITNRLEKAKFEITNVDKYDYVIINDKINNAVRRFKHIMMAEKSRYSRNTEILNIIGFTQEV